jgi:hypothetical protein
MGDSLACRSNICLATLQGWEGLDALYWMFEMKRNFDVVVSREIKI